MQDFTLVIPTYNRPQQLQALLTYLGAQQLQCRVLILDSSQPPQRRANLKIAECQSEIDLRPRLDFGQIG